MKKLIIVSTIICLALLIGSVEVANALNDTVDVSLTVTGLFTFAIGETSLDFGEVIDGAAGGAGATMWCASNLGTAWVIDIKSTAVVGDSTAGEIPLSNLTFSTYALNDGGGVASAGTFVGTDTALALTDQQAYAAALTEYSDTDVQVGLYITLNVPYSTQQDTYRSTVTCTMYPL